MCCPLFLSNQNLIYERKFRKMTNLALCVGCGSSSHGNQFTFWVCLCYSKVGYFPNNANWDKQTQKPTHSCKSASIRLSIHCFTCALVSPLNWSSSGDVSSETDANLNTNVQVHGNPQLSFDTPPSEPQGGLNEKGGRHTHTMNDQTELTTLVTFSHQNQNISKRKCYI